MGDNVRLANFIACGLLGMLLALAAPVGAQPVDVALDATDASRALDQYASYYVDADGQADFATAFDQFQRGRFQPLPDGSPVFGFTSGAHWLHVGVVNRDAAEQHWLLALEYALLDHVDLYVRRADGRIEHSASGDLLPFAMRTIRYRHPNFRIELPVDERVDLLVRVSTKSSMQIPLVLYTPTEFTEMARDAQFVVGIYNGILLALFLYNMVLWLSLRDHNYLWYMLHISGYGLVLFCLNGLAFEYLWPDWPRLANTMIPISMGLSQMAMHQFSRRFLDLRRYWPRGDHIALGVIAFYGLLVLAALVVDYRSAVLIGTATVFPGVLFVLYQADRSLRAGYAPARLFLLAWTTLLAGVAVYALVSFGLLPKTFVTEYGIQIGSAAEMVLLSFALAHRYAALRNENERIVRDANEQLEHNVTRRTAELSNALEQLAEANARLREFSRRDPLTGTFNRRHFRDMFEHAMADALERRQPLSLLMADIDHFKAVNDSHGHLVGDDCLRWITHCMNEVLLPHNAVIARFGGEEFVAVLPGIGVDAARDIAEQLRARVHREPALIGGISVPLTLSIGVHVFQPDRRATPEDALRIADTAMYVAKGQGRNCVRVTVAVT